MSSFRLHVTETLRKRVLLQASTSCKKFQTHPAVKCRTFAWPIVLSKTSFGKEIKIASRKHSTKASWCLTWKLTLLSQSKSSDSSSAHSICNNAAALSWALCAPQSRTKSKLLCSEPQIGRKNKSSQWSALRKWAFASRSNISSSQTRHKRSSLNLISRINQRIKLRNWLKLHEPTRMIVAWQN